MQSWEQHLARWETAGIVDETTVQRIRAFESEQLNPARQRWQVVVALILGGILLGAGVLLFVAAHWDDVSPTGRFLLVLGVLAALHVGAVLSGKRFPAMATVLHGVGTVGAGAAIALVGQIFNMQEHWPAAILMWALCAGAGWWLLGDQFQQVLFLLLVPAWLISEWSYWASNFGGFDVYLARMIAVVAAVYLTAFLHSKRQAVFGILFGVAGVALVVAVGIASDGWTSWYARPGLSVGLRFAAIAVIVATIAVGWMWERRSVIPAVAVMAMMFVLPWLRAKVQNELGLLHSRGAEHIGVCGGCGNGDGAGVVGSEGALASGGELRDCGVCADCGVVLLLEPDGQAGAVAGIDWPGHSVFAGWMVAGEIPPEADGAGTERAERGGHGMTLRSKGVWVLAVQIAVVLSIGVKYAWERHACPMVWARAQQWDPAQPIRGRYIGLTLHADACGLTEGSHTRDLARSGVGPAHWQPVQAQEWHVVPGVRNGVLTPLVVDDTRAGPTQQLTLDAGMPCEYASLSGTSDFFIPEHAKSPFPLQKGQELWALVTVPPSGPVRPVKLAISDSRGFHVLPLE